MGDYFEYVDIDDAQNPYTLPKYAESASAMPATSANVAQQWGCPEPYPQEAFDSEYPGIPAFTAEWLTASATAPMDVCRRAPLTSETQWFPSDVAALPSAVPASDLAPLSMPDLQHPRPRRSYIPPWQLETEFDVKQFVAPARSRHTSPGASPPPTYDYLAEFPLFSAQTNAEGAEGGDVVVDDVDSYAEPEDWKIEEDADAEADQGMETDAADASYDTIRLDPPYSEIDAGTGMGLGRCARTLDSQSLLYQPIPDYVRCPDAMTSARPYGQRQTSMYGL